MNEPAAAAGLRIILSPAANIEALSDFYQRVAGLRRIGGWDRPPGDSGHFLSPPGSRTELELMEMRAAEAGVLPEGSPEGWTLAIEVEDLEAALERCLSAGAPILRDAVDHPWGDRSFVAADPASNPVLFFTRGA